MNVIGVLGAEAALLPGVVVVEAVDDTGSDKNRWGGGIPSFLFRSVVELLIVFAAVESCAKFASMSGTINDDEASLAAECALPWGLARYCVGDVVCMIVLVG